MRGAISIVVASGCVFAGCGGADGTADDAGASDGVAFDAAPPDGRPWSPARLGSVVAASVGASGQIRMGFYDTPASAAGCTWTVDGACSFATCETPGLVAVSAGDVALTFGSNTITVSPDGANVYPMRTYVPTAGTTVTVAAGGGAVGAFQSNALVMPSPIVVTGPEDGSIFVRTSPLTFTWTAASGDVYVTLAQELLGTPYPSTYARSMRCTFPGSAGAGSVPMALVAQLEAGSTSVVIGATAGESLQVGDHEVWVRLLAIDRARTLIAQ